jgi:hypothetical protein
MGYARRLGLDLDRFAEALAERAGAARVAEDVDSADMSGVTGTPTFFINGRRHFGAYGIEKLRRRCARRGRGRWPVRASRLLVGEHESADEVRANRGNPGRHAS